LAVNLVKIRRRRNGAKAQLHKGTMAQRHGGSKALRFVFNEYYYFYIIVLIYINNLIRCIMGNFQNLRVWQMSKDLAVRIYKLTNEELISKDFGFKDQIQRSAVSIPSNIAEGDDLETDKQSIRHFYIAKGSTAELLTQIIIGQEIGYVSESLANELINDCKLVSVMLTKLIKARSR
jgi:four helix bundle protein